MNRTFKLASKEMLEKNKRYGATKYDEFVSIINSPIEEMSEEIFQRERLDIDGIPQNRKWTYAVIHCIMCEERAENYSPFIFCGSCKYNTDKLKGEKE